MNKSIQVQGMDCGVFDRGVCRSGRVVVWV